MPAAPAWLLAIMLLWLILMLIEQATGVFSRRGLEVGPLYLMARIPALGEALRRFALSHARALRYFMSIAVFMGVGQLLFGIYWLAKNLLAFFARPAEASPVSPIIPGVTVGPQVFLKYFLPAIVLIFVSHELAHAVAALAEGIPVRSFGIIVVFVFLGAFVEPDEQSLRRSRPISRLRVFAAGSMANLLLAFIALGAIGGLYHSTSSGVLVLSTMPGYPAHGAIPRYAVIVSLNGTPVSSIDELRQIMARARPGCALDVRFIDPHGVERSVTLRLASAPGNASRAMLGVRIADYFAPRLPLPRGAALELLNFLVSLNMLSLSVAIFNMLPIPPLDGGRFVETLLERASVGGRARRLVMVLLASSALALLLLNVLFTFRPPT